MKKQDYADALFVQDASNLTAVIHGFVQVLERIANFFATSVPELQLEEMNRHPVAVLYASKVASLCSVQTEVPPVIRTFDLRTVHGLEMLVTAQTFEFFLGQLRVVRTLHKCPLGEAELRKHPICVSMALRLVMMTNCESMQTFSLAYEACQAGSAWEADEVPASETWLHQVMSPIVTPDDGKVAEDPPDWRCADCGATGHTHELRYDGQLRTMVCSQCCKPAIVPLTAILTEELKDPEALAQAIQIHLGNPLG